MTVSTNPFAPPQAAVADLSAQAGGFQQVKPFSAKGRLGRLRFLAYSTLAYLAIYIPVGVIVISVGPGGAALALNALALVAYIILYAMFGIQRSHDMDWSGWMTLLALIPLVGLVWVFKAGTPGSNNYGAPPPPNSLGVKIFGWILPLIAIIGILAAIALPAYQQYVMRAKAAQVR